MTGSDPFDCRTTLGGAFGEPTGSTYFSLARAEQNGAGPITSLPWVLRSLVEGLLRRHDHPGVMPEHVLAVTRRDTTAAIPFLPGRVLLQDASGIPVLADLVTLQERAAAEGLPLDGLTPVLPLDLVVDHALEVDRSAVPEAAAHNLELELTRHRDRYQFLRWAQERLPGLRVVPPGVGICHQLNLEVLATVVTTTDTERGPVVGLDSLVGTDSHTTMVNALSVAGWGVGGIEAMAAALGQPVLIRVPRVVGVRLDGELGPGVFASDLALTLAARLRQEGVVGAVVEFHGPGLSRLSVPDRATVANMAPEYGATMAWFPADERTLSYLAATGRPERHLRLAERYLRAQGLLHSAGAPVPSYDSEIVLDLGDVRTTLAGPSRPHERLALGDVPRGGGDDQRLDRVSGPAGSRTGDLVIAAITSCTNTSNPRSLVAAGLLARNAVQRGLRVPPWTKTSFTPGSRAAADLLVSAGLQEPLDRLGFTMVGFGCGTCMGNSGPLVEGVSAAVRASGAQVAAILSGNRNFTGRVHPDVAHAYLASPAMVVAYALAGHVRDNLDTQPLGRAADGSSVTLRDIWPQDSEIEEMVALHEKDSLGRSGALPLTTPQWRAMRVPQGTAYDWDDEPGSIRRPPFADPALTRPVVTGDIVGARPLLVLGDGVTTDHISPVARVVPDSHAGRWLTDRGVSEPDLGTFSSRRLNHDVMVRGGFANPQLENLLAGGRRGAWTRTAIDEEVVPLHEAAFGYAAQDVPTVVVAGDMYGAGSARDWAAKVTRLLGIRAVLARGFERIHRTNLVALGVLPIEWDGPSGHDLVGSDCFDIIGLDRLTPGAEVVVTIRRGDAVLHRSEAVCRLDSELEVAWMRAGGLLGHLIEDASQRPPRQP